MGYTRNTGTKLTGTLALAAFAALSSTGLAQTAVPVPPGLVGWWALDGNGEDFGPSAVQGVIAGAGGTYEPAEVLRGLRPAAPDGRLAVTDFAALHVRTAFTIEMWVKLDSLPVGLTWFVNKGSSNHRLTPYAMGVIGSNGLMPRTSGASQTGTPGPGRPFLVMSDGSLEQVLIGSAPLPLGTFVHLAGSVHPQSTQTQGHIYVNGVQSVVAFLGRLPFAGTQDLQLGGVAATAAVPGVVDEVSIYNRGLAQGEIQAIVAAGTAGKVKPIRDHTPPSVRIDAPLAGAVFGSRTVAVQATITDESATTVTSVPAGLSANLPAGGGQASGTVSLNGADGDVTIAVQAVDVANNQGATAVQVTLDTTPPVVAIPAPSEGAIASVSPLSFAVQVGDLTATSIVIGGQSRSLPPGQSTILVDVPLVEGNNAITCDVVDAAGNHTTVVRNVVLDLSAPLVAILSPADGTLFGPGQTGAAVTVRVDDLTATTVASAPAGVSGSLPAGGGLQSGVMPLQEGLNVLTVHADDSAGHGADATITVNLDTTAPQATFTAPMANALVRGTIEVIASAADVAPGSGVLSVDLFVDGNGAGGAAGGSLATELDTTTLTDGTHELRLQVSDGAGNVGQALTWIRVDNTPPEVRVLSPLPNDVVRGQVPFSVLASDAQSGLVALVQRVGGRAPGVDGSQTFSPPLASAQADGSEDSTQSPNGPLQFEVEATDDAGNTTRVLVDVTVENPGSAEPPGLRPRDGQHVQGEVRLSLSSERTDVVRMELFVDGRRVAQGNSSPLRVRFDTTTRLDGPMVVRGVVTTVRAGFAETIHTLRVDNMHVLDVLPSALALQAGEGEVRVLVTGPNRALLTAPGRAFALKVPGGSQVPMRLLAPARRDCGHVVTLVADRTALVGALLAARATGALPAEQHRAHLRVLIDGVDVGGDSVYVVEGRNGRR